MTNKDKEIDKIRRLLNECSIDDLLSLMYDWFSTDDIKEFREHIESEGYVDYG